MKDGTSLANEVAALAVGSLVVGVSSTTADPAVDPIRSTPSAGGPMGPSPLRPSR